MKSIKFIAMLFLLTIWNNEASCCEKPSCAATESGDDEVAAPAKADSSDKPKRKWIDDYALGSDGQVLYRLVWDKEYNISTIEIKAKPKTGGTTYVRVGPPPQLPYKPRRTIIHNSLGVLTKKRVNESLEYLHDNIIDSYYDEGIFRLRKITRCITIVGKIDEEVSGGVMKSKKLKGLIPDRSLLMDYFAGMACLEYIEIYGINLFVKLAINRDGTLKESWQYGRDLAGNEYWTWCRLKRLWESLPEGKA